MSVTVDGKPVDYSPLPSHLQGGMRLWVEDGIQPGSFLSAVLTNNLVGALASADSDSRIVLDRIAQFVHWEIPALSHGSREACRAWAASHGRAWK